MRRRYYMGRASLQLGEVPSLIISVLVVSLVFAGWESIMRLDTLTWGIVLSGVIPAFLLHELAHRYVARRYGCYAKYVLSPLGTLISLISTLIPIKVIIVGYVGISCPSLYYYNLYNAYRPVSQRKVNAYIALSGPLTNLVIAVLLKGLVLIPSLTTSPLIYWVITSSAKVNTWLALFNLIPLTPLDGSKIFTYKPVLSIALLMISLALFYII